ncbi:hypothetical protein A2U01_0053506, partial [Trifolium medium]|nr:hypothetical protein [Trifolium medium]
SRPCPVVILFSSGEWRGVCPKEFQVRMDRSWDHRFPLRKLFHHRSGRLVSQTAHCSLLRLRMVVVFTGHWS